MRCKTLFVITFLAGAVALVGVGVYFAVRTGSSQVEHAYVAFDISPDGKQIVFSSADADLYLFNLRTRQVQQLTKSAALETSPAFSPDGRFVAYASRATEGGGAGIYVRSLDGKKVQELTRGQDTLDMMPSYSSDGKQVTFVRAVRHRPYSMGGLTWDNYDVYVINRDGSGMRRVTQHGYYQASRPHFTDGGRTILFAGTGDYPDTQTYLSTVPTAGSQPATKFVPPAAPLSNNGSSPSYCATWGSDPYPGLGGKQIVFISDRSQSYAYDLWVMGANGGKPHALKVTEISHFNQEPVFMPDGDHILLLAGTEWNASSRPIFSLWEVNADGSHPHRIVGSELFTRPLPPKPKP